jgi:SAM-dependent methyltransferase
MNVTALMKAQFEKERELAQLIMSAPEADRKQAYASAYEELYRLFPHLQTDEAEESSRVIYSTRFIAPFVRATDTVVEIGAGRCRLAIALSERVKEVIALDVAELTETPRFPANVHHRVFDGIELPFASQTVDVIVSDNVLEHLHPDDGRRQMAEAYRVLKPGGYLCLLTPNPVSGPHDISAAFASTPMGLHLKEYSCREIRTLLTAVGFRGVHSYIGTKGRYIPTSPELGALIEGGARLLPRSVARSTTMRWLLPQRFVARKQSDNHLG